MDFVYSLTEDVAYVFSDSPLLPNNVIGVDATLRSIAQPTGVRRQLQVPLVKSPLVQTSVDGRRPTRILGADAREFISSPVSGNRHPVIPSPLLERNHHHLHGRLHLSKAKARLREETGRMGITGSPKAVELHEFDSATRNVLSPPISQLPGNGDTTERRRDRLPLKGLVALCALRFSSAWGERSSAFATYLFLVVVFPSTLVPASAFGLCTTASGILLSGWAGGLVDKYGRIPLVRWTTVVQKLSTVAIYSLMLVFLLVDRTRRSGSALMVLCMAAATLAGCVEKVSTTCLAVSIERDWPSVISAGSSGNLTTMNAWLRRADLVCDLLSPLFVSALSAGVSYLFAAGFLAGMTVVCFALELVLIIVVQRCFPVLGDSTASGHAHHGQEALEEPTPAPSTSISNVTRRLIPVHSLYSAFMALIRDIVEFSALPVFFTSLSIASIYLTVLSFDGLMVTYLKNTLSYTDPFLAGQKAACTAAGLLGTVLFPFVMRRIGLVRTGSWAIWSEFACLLPVVISLYLAHSASNESQMISPLLATALFGGMALSRIGLWMFDLSQLQILQESLENHPRRNRLTSIQFTLQNTFDMAKYALTIGLAKPSQFRWAGLVSVVAVFVGGLLYVFGYARRVRGHVAPHWSWLAKLKII